MIENHDLLKSVVAKAIQDSQTYNWKNVQMKHLHFLAVFMKKTKHEQD
jgi:hypothetical protein